MPLCVGVNFLFAYRAAGRVGWGKYYLLPVTELTS